MEAKAPSLIHSWNFGKDEESTRERLLKVTQVITRKDLEALKEGIALGLDINEWFIANPEALKSSNVPQSYTGRTPRRLREIHEEDRLQVLHLATTCRWKEGVEELIRSGAEVNAYDHSAAHQTISSTQIEKVRTGSSYTPLMHACCYGNVPQVKVLLEYGADPCAKDPLSSSTPLSLAMKFYSFPILKLLLDHGAKFIQTDTSALPLQEIIEIFNKPMFKVTNARQYGPKEVEEMAANVKNVSLYLLRSFLEYGADPNMIQRDRLPPLHMCAEGAKDDTRAMELLVAHGADVNNICKATYCHAYTQMSPLLAAILAEDGQTTSAQWLIQHGADVNAKFIEHYRGRVVGEPISLLNIALKNFLVPATTILVRAGCEVTQEDIDSMKSLLTEIKMTDTANFQETGEHIPALEASIDNMEETLDFVRQPQDLKWQIRRAVRSRYGLSRVENVNSLPLPRQLKNFILCHDL